MSQWDFFTKGINKIKNLNEIISPRVKQLLSGTITTKDYKQMKLRANWTEELDEIIMKRIFKGEELMSSMADQGLIEALVFGSFIDINSIIVCSKPNFHK